MRRGGQILLFSLYSKPYTHIYSYDGIAITKQNTEAICLQFTVHPSIIITINRGKSIIGVGGA